MACWEVIPYLLYKEDSPTASKPFPGGARGNLVMLLNSSRGKLTATIKLLQTEIDDILEREDTKWKQRAKQNWYRSRDQNTQYFHS
jgi:hypothetical protein